ncbi:hypothetical protein B0H10DRAFT_1960636 [Mycena sp. CBHHK59/15]|nr:hypothetical protein B0H10DRAFT_1960636 [Mycena sp. CBHHK59/15]
MNGRCENERHAGSTDGGIRIFQNRKEVLDVCVADEKLDYSEEADAVEGFNKSAETSQRASLEEVVKYNLLASQKIGGLDSLIALFELKNVLTEGTFFSAQVTMHTYIFYGNGIPSKVSFKLISRAHFHQTNSRIQVYHLYVDKLRVLDKGYGAAWQIPIPSFPVAGPSGPSTPSPKKRKERDDTADDAFEAFDTVTPKKKF